MNVEKLFNWAQRIGAALVLTLMAGCGSGTPEETAGTISMSLTGTAPSGAQYRLANATFDIEGPESSTVVSDPDQPVLNVNVTPGSYTVILQDGWQVQRFEGATWVDVDGVLTSNPVVALTVVQGGISEATYSFGIGDEFISFGKGRVSIGAEFDDELVPGEGEVITLTAAGRGWWNSVGFHSNGNLNTITGELYGDEYRSYFTFDVSGTPVGVIGATLRLEIEQVASPDTEALTIRDVSTSATDLDANDPGSAAGIAIFDDLGSGSTYGDFAVNAADIGTIVDIPLSGDVLADLNATTTTFSVGVSLDVLELSEWVRFSAGNEVRVHELVMQYPPE